jgi:hypothetical protein
MSTPPWKWVRRYSPKLEVMPSRMARGHRNPGFDGSEEFVESAQVQRRMI